MKLWSTADAKEIRSLAANPPTLAMRLDAAKSDLTIRQTAAAAAARAFEAARKGTADKQKALAAATETQAALATSVAALAKVKDLTAEAKAAAESVGR